MEPRRAKVRPRIIASAGGEPLLLEDELRPLVDERRVGAIALVGGAGAGKTTALQHLADVFKGHKRVSLLDEPDAAAVLNSMTARLVVYATRKPHKLFHVASYELTPWGKDDLIEYLLASHKDKCASVLARINAADFELLAGAPKLWAIVLEALAHDEELADGSCALRHHADRIFAAETNLPLVSELALAALLREPPATKLDASMLSFESWSLLRFPAVRMLVAAEKIVADIKNEVYSDWHKKQLPLALIRTAAHMLERAPPFLCQLLTRQESAPFAATMCFEIDPAWRTEPGEVISLAGACLANARWPGIMLAGMDLTRTDFTGANLQKADLAKANATECRLDGVCLRNALLQNLQARKASFRGADLASVTGPISAPEANLEAAILDKADLRGSSFVGANLCAANFRNAKLTRAVFHNARVEDTDFHGAQLVYADLSGLKLFQAHLRDIDFSFALLKECDLETVEIPAAKFHGADLTGALLTGSTMPDADFSEACLRNAGLADIDWPRANLRGADLRGVSFHLGSTRSGLVGSPIASEGTRTGFYTDDYEEQHFKAPEEIRKANLHGADLRDANLDGVDFYLVDLRDARIDTKYEAHLRSTGAILDNSGPSD